MSSALCLALDTARLTPRKVVKVPEGVGWQEEVPHGQEDQIDNQPDDEYRLEPHKRYDKAREEKDGKQHGKWDGRREIFRRIHR